MRIPALPLRRLAAGLLALAVALPAAAFEAPEDLPEGPGREETFWLCTACHGFAIVAAQGMTRERWDATLDWMVERHGMYEPDPEERALILDYLASTYPPKAAPGGWQNPFAPKPAN